MEIVNMEEALCMKGFDGRVTGMQRMVFKTISGESKVDAGPHFK